nr:MAG TPA: hypothetical protein [Crassvirales sp.]
MSKGRKYKIPHKYLSKYPIRKRTRYKVMGGKNRKKSKFKFFRHLKFWKTLEGHISMRKMVAMYSWIWD